MPAATCPVNELSRVPREDGAGPALKFPGIASKS